MSGIMRERTASPEPKANACLHDGWRYGATPHPLDWFDGDTDTVACIADGIAEASFFQILTIAILRQSYRN